MGSKCVSVFCDTAAAEEMPTGRLERVREQVVTYRAGEGKKEVNRKALGDQLGTQVVPLTVGDILHPLLSLDSGFFTVPEH